MARPQNFSQISAAADFVLRELSGEIVMATPLGLGKPIPMVNAIYEKVKSDSSRKLRIFTALSLAVPKPGSDIERRFLGPFSERQWGADYPELAYLRDLEARCLPSNIRVHEFYLQAGKSLHRPEVQRDYISLNYTHVAQGILDQDINVLVQMVARKGERYSLSCNPDLTLDVVDLYKKVGRKLMVVGVVHPDLPFCAEDAEVGADFFDVLVESPSEMKHKLFALPRQPIGDADFMIGLHASLIIEDGGTLQIGIGSLSDALVYCTLLRHKNNEAYRAIVEKLLRARPVPKHHERFFLEPFKTGLYGTSEMVTDGFMHLRRGGILKREIFDQDDKKRRYLHGAFYLGSNEFYEWLRERDREGDTGFAMTRVSKVNDLYDPNELAIRRQRVKARFFNTCMNVTLLGGAASDTTEDGQVVSGVGGQYNFVAMSHELPDSYSALMLRSTRHAEEGLVSNFVWGQGQQTIPRHLRDVVISEFGVAFLKNRSDEDVVKALLCVAGEPFQEGLRNHATRNSKLSAKWVMPEWCGENSEHWPSEFLREFKVQGLFPSFPFGSDFTTEEERLAIALLRLKAASRSAGGIATTMWRGLMHKSSATDRTALTRMGYDKNLSVKDRFYRRLLLGVL